MIPFLHRIAAWIGGAAAYRFHLRYWFHPDADIAAGLLGTLRPARALQPVLSEGPEGQRIVVIAPHPDDEVIGPGGTLIKARQQGREVKIIFLTDGEATADQAELRRGEARRVAQEFNFEIAFLGLPADGVAQAPQGPDRLAAELVAAQPDVIFVPFLLDDNDDHRAAARLLAQVVPQVSLAPGIEVWAYQVYSALPANVLVPLGDWAAVKAKAICLYASQMEVRDWANFSLGLNAYNTRLAPRRCRDKHIEAFFVLPLPAYLKLCRRGPV